MSLRRNTRPARQDWLTEELADVLAVGLADVLPDVLADVGGGRGFIGGQLERKVFRRFMQFDTGVDRRAGGMSGLAVLAAFSARVFDGGQCFIQGCGFFGQLSGQGKCGRELGCVCSRHTQAPELWLPLLCHMHSGIAQPSGGIAQAHAEMGR